MYTTSSDWPMHGPGSTGSTWPIHGPGSTTAEVKTAEIKTEKDDSDGVQLHFYLSEKEDGKTSSKEDVKISGERNFGQDYGGYGKGNGGYGGKGRYGGGGRGCKHGNGMVIGDPSWFLCKNGIGRGNGGHGEKGRYAYGGGGRGCKYGNRDAMAIGDPSWFLGDPCKNLT